MENISEVEKQVIEIVKTQFEVDGGNNGVDSGAFDHILKLRIEERNEFLQRMVKEKKIVMFNSLNSIRITLKKV